jgi:hypothetical protein
MIGFVFNEPFCEVSGSGMPLGHPIVVVRFVLSIFPIPWIGFWMCGFGGRWNLSLSQVLEHLGIEPCVAFSVCNLANKAAVPIG